MALADMAIKQAKPQEGSFEAVALEWFAQKSPEWAESHSSKVMTWLERIFSP